MARSLTVAAECDRPGIDAGMLEGLLGPMLDGDIEIVLTDPGCMRVLNRRFRMIDRPTDVLTFDLSEGPGAPDGVIYVDCRLFPPLEAVLERVFHGYLHLAGHTHDSPGDEEEMSGLTAELVRRAMEAAG